MTRHFLKDDDISALEQAAILDLALELKAKKHDPKPLAGPKTVALLFDKSSTRTRVSFAVGVTDLGGYPLIIDTGNSQLGGSESPADTARVLERQVAMIVWRTYAQSGLDEMAAHSSVPVVNSLSDDYHPCQLLADLLTIREQFDKTEGLKLAFIGDASCNTAASYLLACTIAGMHVSIAGPSQFTPSAEVLARTRALAQAQGTEVTVTTDPAEALKNADVVVTDTWVSMGKEQEKQQRLETFAGFTVDASLMALALPSAVFLHCLPAYRGYEVTADVLDGPQSLIWQQAENRLHAQKALMHWLLQQ